MRRHVASRRGDGLACTSLQLHSPGNGAGPAPHACGCCTPTGTADRCGTPPTPGDAHALLLLAVPFLGSHCFASPAMCRSMREGKATGTHPAEHQGWVRVDLAVVASHHRRVQLIHSQQCIPDTGWRCPVLRALLAPMEDKAAGTGQDPAPLKDVRTGHLGIRVGTGLSFLAAMCSSLKLCVCWHGAARSSRPLSAPPAVPLHSAVGANMRRWERVGGCWKCRQIALDG